MIIDEVKIHLKAGDGGEGSFSSLKLSSRRVIGGGGDGGRGGNVILKVSSHLYDLSKFNDNKRFIAENGERGKENNRKGKSGQDLIVYVPKGTLVLDSQANLIIDLAEENSEYLICRAGSAGRGNYKKLYALPAQKGEAKEIILYYCIPNDVAIVGLPNCGKTSLFNKFTAKSYKVADYPFTTKTCVWAPVEVDFKKITFMDTPAIKNQPKAPYAENNFLRHLLRSKIIIMVSDNPGGFNDEFRLLKKEISAFDKKLLKGKKILYILNKVDKIDKSSLDLKGIIVVSTIDGTGIEALKKKIIKRLKSSYQFSAVSSQQLIAES